ncbi:YcaO-like family protein [Streptomyces scabiei]|uniref:YcaO-like family protein n=5 Tax=Streptomyces scabiei TaxID=1930 RepID=UPI0029AB7FE0|nr:YcaO-like family protein [Streptomyces scabiei]MDX2685439.1 YcaO-like family protein [Streptomyces scabiei]MDX2748623.1 YcaO-like family protein [Streptomyces scabiei]
MSADGVTLRLVDVEIYDIERDLCFLVTANGGQFYISAPPSEFRSWAARCDGTRTRSELLSGMAPEYAEVVDILLHDGSLRPARATEDADRAAGLARTTVLLTGVPELTAPIAHALEPVGYARVEPAPGDLTGVDTRDTVLVAAFAHPAHKELARLDELCAGLGLRWLPLRRERGRALLGPAVTPGLTADFTDVLERRLAAAPDPRVVAAVRDADEPAGGPPSGADARWVAAQLGAYLERWVAEGAGGDEVELDARGFGRIHRTVLPVPTRPRPVTRGDAEADLLVDDQVGVVTGVQELAPLPGMPARLRACAVDVADMRRVADWPNDRQAFGTSWSGFDGARRSAVGEAVERYCGSRLPQDRLRVGSYTALRRAGVPALDPRRLHLYSRRQYLSDGFPFVPLTTDSECAWVEGRSWTTGEPVWVPAFLVAHGEHDPVAYSDPLVAGVAAGVTQEQAVTSGLEEVIERDTTMLWWANTPRLPRLPMPERIHELVHDSLDAYDITLIHLDNEFDVPVLAAAVSDRANRRLTIGFAARPDALQAAEKALAEGFTLHHTCHYLDNDKALAEGQEQLPHLGNLKPYRADRRYLDSYRADFVDVRDLLCQQQLHLDPRAGERVAPWVRDLPTGSWDGLPALPERSLAAYRERVEARGFEVISVDLTTCDVEAAGFSAAHTIVPGLVSNFPAGMPMWGGGRIADAAVRLGWRPEPPAEEELNHFPLPHA